MSREVTRSWYHCWTFQHNPPFTLSDVCETVVERFWNMQDQHSRGSQRNAGSSFHPFASGQSTAMSQRSEFVCRTRPAPLHLTSRTPPCKGDTCRESLRNGALLSKHRRLPGHRLGTPKLVADVVGTRTVGVGTIQEVGDPSEPIAPGWNDDVCDRRSIRNLPASRRAAPGCCHLRTESDFFLIWKPRGGRACSLGGKKGQLSSNWAFG